MTSFYYRFHQQVKYSVNIFYFSSGNNLIRNVVQYGASMHFYVHWSIKKTSIASKKRVNIAMMDSGNEDFCTKNLQGTIKCGWRRVELHTSKKQALTRRWFVPI